MHPNGSIGRASYSCGLHIVGLTFAYNFYFVSIEKCHFTKATADEFVSYFANEYGNFVCRIVTV